MGMLKPYMSFRQINCLIDKDKFEHISHHNAKINGKPHGCSAFYRNKSTGNFVYILTDMIPCLEGVCLIRAALHEKDYVGGVNNYARDEFTFSKLMTGCTERR